MWPGHSNQTHLRVGRFRGHVEWRHFPTIKAIEFELGDGWMDGWIGYTYIGTSTVAKCLGQCTVSRTQVATSAHYEKQGSIFLLSLPVRNVRLLNEIFSRACHVRIALRKERVMITWLANKP
jgi:hypothetical protein